MTTSYAAEKYTEFQSSRVSTRNPRTLRTFVCFISIWVSIEPGKHPESKDFKYMKQPSFLEWVSIEPGKHPESKSQGEEMKIKFNELAKFQSSRVSTRNPRSKGPYLKHVVETTVSIEPGKHPESKRTVLQTVREQ